MNRAFDYETKEMLRVKNKERSILVVYDDDETIASRSAITLIDYLFFSCSVGTSTYFTYSDCNITNCIDPEISQKYLYKRI